jgi:Protein of unknown function (DUF3047)
MTVMTDRKALRSASSFIQVAVPEQAIVRRIEHGSSQSQVPTLIERWRLNVVLGLLLCGLQACAGFNQPSDSPAKQEQESVVGSSPVTGSAPTGVPDSTVAEVIAENSTAKDGVLELFPTELKSGVMPVGWERWILHPLKRKTEYGWKKDRKGVYLEAKSRASASGMIKRLNIDPLSLPFLQFSWMIDGLLEGADVGDRALEDSPVRVVLAFDGEKSKLPLKDQAFIERVKTFTGQDVPYASLMYVWDNNRALNTVVANPHTGRIQKVVASSGPSGVRTWQMHQRNIVADYRAAFGKEPGKLIGIAIMTDTDNTKTRAQARYRDLSLSQTAPVAMSAKSN